MRIPIGHVRVAAMNTSVCLRNLGPGKLTIAGTTPDPGYTMQVAGATVPSRLRVDYLRPGRENWLELLPTVVHRFSLAKAGFLRHWAWLAVALLMLTAIAVAMLTALREEQP